VTGVQTCALPICIDILFVGDDHNYYHKAIFQQPGLVEKCNADKINVVVLTSEKVCGTIFPQNEDNYNYLQRFDHLYHYTCDVGDCKKLGTKLHRICMSRQFQNTYTQNKVDKMIFIGSAIEYYYQNRIVLLDQISKIIPIDIVINPLSNTGANISKFTWDAYMNMISQYRFVLSPLGLGDYLTLRFYEILLAGSIPVQQVGEDTLKYYDIEAGFDDCIFFRDINEIPDKINKCTLGNSYNKIWLENYLGKILREDGLY
jgi:hypothetical protein